jgi:hypothetical protein
MRTGYGRVLKLAGLVLLAASVAGVPSVVSARDRGHGHGGHVVVVPRGGGHYHAHRYYGPRVYRYGGPYYVYRPYVYEPYYVAPPVYGYVPLYPGGNLSLTLDFPFRF